MHAHPGNVDWAVAAKCLCHAAFHQHAELLYPAESDGGYLLTRRPVVEKVASEPITFSRPSTVRAASRGGRLPSAGSGSANYPAVMIEKFLMTRRPREEVWARLLGRRALAGAMLFKALSRSASPLSALPPTRAA